MVDYAALARSILGEDIATTIESFPSGAVVIDVRAADRHAAIAGRPGAAEWGVSVDPSPEQAFTGYEHIVASAEAAFTLIRDAFRTSR
ncbi:conserved hypothetical protein [Frankia canadensis]|uniref:Uncharacterized protein n=1 Tax=Frankia canadensis TaxID=1836972 RepID=A0A2I2KQV6_9ACTN|nr:hypothetical protein [Frankia canadensis]SNQ48030.1 conserved hypothetical protein [Frankia canadensis]SOU55320.1 conserved hypothetical protein [Frankia canadensis]